MRKSFLIAWLLLPAAAAAYHFGPGQDRLRSDAAASAVDRARAAVRRANECGSDEDAAREQWTIAEAAWADALQSLPPDSERAMDALRLERSKAALQIGKLPEARQELRALVERLDADPTADPELASDARRTLANAQYYMTWLMRLEGASREEWEPEIEASRQNYRLAAERAQSRGDELVAKASREDLEAAIRLERMDLKDLQGLPLPSQ